MSIFPKHVCSILFRALVASAFSASAATLYVSATAAGGGDGTESNPYTYKEGIAAARDNDVVQLADGVYTAETKTGNQDPYNLYDYDNVTVIGNVEHPENVVLDAHGNGVRFLGIKSPQRSEASRSAIKSEAVTATRPSGTMAVRFAWIIACSPASRTTTTARPSA